MSMSSARKHPLYRRKSPREPATSHLTRETREAAQAEVAGYIAHMSAEMMVMAARANLDLLSYLLSIARTEAETVAHRGGSHPPGIG